MKFNGQQLLRAIVLLAFTYFLIHLHISGDILKYINPKYKQLSQIGALLFFVLFLVQITQIRVEKAQGDCTNHHHCHHDHSHDQGGKWRRGFSYGVIIFPLLTGFMLPPKTLDASVAAKKGAMVSLTNQVTKPANNSTKDEQPLLEPGAEKSPKAQVDKVAQPENPEVSDGQDGQIDDEIDPNLYSNKMTEEEYGEIRTGIRDSNSTINMTESVYSIYYEEINSNIEYYEGRNVTIEGFVYKEEEFGESELVLARFLITHCVADASIVGFLSEVPEAASIDEDTWLRVEGTFSTGDYQGTPLPSIQVTSWEIIDEPEQPYIYYPIIDG
ncbi:TIGR03943 family putative permease subunit [Salirhabdus salicampi]|uniref:TIGR03943 family putative permease subunit n=1 Tax=Salirhabdus salicampi TaxID=476102 RepID=UPI0020C346A9|nr:TIGR03943 family protein [Salirhabdus salicampi]MCP8615428.1 TIGR03943 family protein [Salirhabdus salicampi]